MHQNTEPQKPAGETTLIRAVGLFTGTLLVAGVMIGSGVFKKIVPMSQTGLSEGWIIMAWVIAGIITMLGAFNLAGLSSLTEESGGVYEYLRLSAGNFFSFLFGWTDFAIIGTASAAALGFIFAQSVNTLVHLPDPLQHWEHISIGGFIYPFADSGIKILAIGSIMLLTYVNCRGVKEGGAVNNIFTGAKIIGILGIIILGIFFASPETVQSGTSVAVSEAKPFGSSGFYAALFTAMLSASWAYDGWLDISFITGEIKNPKRNVPLAIIIGVSTAMALYVMVNYAYMHAMPLDKLAAIGPNEIGASVVMGALTGDIGKTLIIALIMVSVFGSLNAVILSHARIYFRMAQEKFFFSKAAFVHPKFRTPYNSLIYTMAWSCVLVVSGTFDILTDMVILANFIFYGFLAVAAIKMKKAGMIKTRLIGYPVVQWIIILFSLALIINTITTQPKESLTGLALVFSGVPFYYYFKKKKTDD